MLEVQVPVLERRFEPIKLLWVWSLNSSSHSRYLDLFWIVGYFDV
jgi:hypothetical protein